MLRQIACKDSRFFEVSASGRGVGFSNPTPRPEADTSTGAIS
ncbi:hypothetical protein [Spirosoma sp. KNUC1025]